MNITDFNSQLNKLEDAFNARFTGVQKNMLLERVGILSPNEWESVIENALLAGGKAPTIPVIISMATPLLNEARRRSQAKIDAQIQSSGFMCPGCLNTGMATVVTPKGGLSTVRCKCKVAKIKNISRHMLSLERAYEKGCKLADWPKSGHNKAKVQKFTQTLGATMPITLTGKKIDYKPSRKTEGELLPVTKSNIRKYLEREIEQLDLDLSTPEKKAEAYKFIQEIYADDERERKREKGREGVGQLAEDKPKRVGKERAAEQGDS